MYEETYVINPLNSNNIRSVFDKLQENFSIVNSIHFMDNFRHLPKETMLENWSYLYEMNTSSSVNFLNQLIQTSGWNDEKLLECKTEITDFIHNIDASRTEKLNETINIIDKVIEDSNSLESLKDNALSYLFESRFRKYCVYESYLDNELEIIMYNINYSPETIAELELLIRKIKLSSLTQVIASFPKLLERSTDMIRFINITLTGDVLNLVVSIPMVIANKLVDGKVNKNQIKTYIKMIDRQIIIISKTLKTEGKPELYNMYTSYLKNLVKAKELLSEQVSDKLIENIAEMQPDTIMYNESVVDDLTGEIEEMLTNMIFDPDDEINMESFNEFVRLAKTYNCLCEKANPIVRGAVKVGKVNQKIGTKAIAASKETDRVKTALKRSLDPLINLVSNTVNKIKDSDKKARTEAIITGGYKGKLLSVIRKVILSLATFAGGTAIRAGIFGKGTTLIAIKGFKIFSKLTNPALIAVSILVGIAIDKAIDKKYRQSILNDLETELRLVTEKIEDARGDSNREAKYELMRLQNKLQKEVDRIKFGLK